MAEGLVDGLRIDHIDGLADPRGYCRKLRRRVDRLAPQRHLPIYVEKILGEGETLHRDWSVDGSTGYEFMNQLSLLQHDPEGAQTLGELWSRHSERPADFRQEAQLARQQILNGSLAGDFESVAHALLQVARDDLMTRDLTLGAIRRALQELIVHFPVYRTYISPLGRAAQDEVFFSSKPWTVPGKPSARPTGPCSIAWPAGSAANPGANTRWAAHANCSSMRACASSN